MFWTLSHRKEKAPIYIKQLSDYICICRIPGGLIGRVEKLDSGIYSRGYLKGPSEL